MYRVSLLTAPPADLRKIKIGLVDTGKGIVCFVEEGLHEVLAREICEDRNYDWRCDGRFVSAVDYLLEEQEFIKLSNYGQDNIFRCLTAAGKCLKKSKNLSEWMECLKCTLSLRADLY